MFSRSDDQAVDVDTEMMALSDSLLLQRLTRGDAASFDALFYRHYDRVYGLLFRLVGNRAEAEDVAQEVFLKLHDHGRGRRAIGQDENVGGWLYRVAMNLGYNALRERARRDARNVHLVPEAEAGIESQADRREERALVRAALARLPERQALLLLLRQMNFSYAECAAICEVAPGSVGTLLARAAAAFRREYLALAGQEEERT